MSAVLQKLVECMTRLLKKGQILSETSFHELESTFMLFIEYIINNGIPSEIDFVHMDELVGYKKSK